MRILKQEPAPHGMVSIQALTDGGRLVRFVIADDADEDEIRAFADHAAEHQREGFGFLDPNSPIPESAHEEREE